MIYSDLSNQVYRGACNLAAGETQRRTSRGRVGGVVAAPPLLPGPQGNLEPPPHEDRSDHADELRKYLALDWVKHPPNLAGGDDEITTRAPSPFVPRSSENLPSAQRGLPRRIIGAQKGADPHLIMHSALFC